MTNLDRLQEGLFNADRAGDSVAAQTFADQIRSLRSASPKPAPTSKPQSLSDQLKRQAGLTARAGLEGLTGLGRAVGDTSAALWNAPTGLINRAAGTHIPRAAPVTPNFESALDYFLPKPATGLERMVNAAGSSLASAAPQLGVASIAREAPGIAQNIARLLAARPAAQAAGAVTGGLGAQSAAELGAGPLGQTAAGMAAGALPFAAGRPSIPSGVGKLRAETWQDARRSGFKVSPTEVNPSFPNTIVESIPSRSKVSQRNSKINNEVRSRLAKEDMGIDRDGSLSPATLDEIREEAGKKYDAIRDQMKGVKAIKATPQFQQQIRSAFDDAMRGSGAFPNTVETGGVQKLAQDFLDRGSFPPRDAFDVIRTLRRQASANLNSSHNVNDAQGVRGRFEWKTAQAMDDLINHHLEASGNAKLFNEYRDARQTIAKSYDLQAAMNPASGDISGAKLAKLLDKGRPLSGGLETAARFARAFPKDNMDVERVGPMPTYNAWDFLVAGGTALAGHPILGAAELASRGLTPSILSSNWYQRHFANPATSLRGPSGVRAGLVNQLLQGLGRTNPP